MKKFFLLMIISSVLFNSNAMADGKEDGHGHKKEHEHDKNEPHDDFLKIGEIGFLKLKKDLIKGYISVDLYKLDKKTKLTIDGDLKLNAIHEKMKKTLVLKMNEHHKNYEVLDDFLKQKVEGRFVFKTGDKQYVVKIEEHEHHNKDDHHNGGHDHHD